MSMGVTRLETVSRVGAKRARALVWIDIDNPPQVQYLLPFRGVFDAAGLDTVVTARDYGRTVEMLQAAGAHPHVFGKRVGSGKVRKGAAAVMRAREQMRFFAKAGRPDVLLAASRSSAVAAWRMRIPAYLIGDYEHIHLAVYRLTGSKIFYPEIVGSAHYVSHGLREEQLIPFRGLKEDLTFAGLDVARVEPYNLGEIPADTVRVLFRPPSETSHYHDARSGELARQALEWLAGRGALVVFSPREANQVALLNGLRWSHPPVILHRSVPFVALLKSVDAVVCAGGTMLREAAYLGIPAYSIFCSQTGAVDRWLQEIGRAALLRSPAEFSAIALRKRGPLERLDSNPNLLDQLAGVVIAAAAQRSEVNRCLAAA